MRNPWLCGGLLACATVLAACESDVTATSGGAGTAGAAGATSAAGPTGAGGGATSASGGTGGSVPDACKVETTAPPPYGVTLRFENKSMSAVYLRQTCALEVEIQACATGWSPLTLSGVCTVPCSDPSAPCIACGACAVTAVPIPGKGSYDFKWDGRYVTLGTNAQGCQCHDNQVAVAAKYRVRAPIYGSEQDAIQFGMPAVTVMQDFELPTAGGVVVVPAQP